MLVDRRPKVRKLKIYIKETSEKCMVSRSRVVTVAKVDDRKDAFNFQLYVIITQ